MPSLPSPEDLESSPVWSVIRAAHTLERNVTALFAVYDLTPVQFGVLSYLGANGPMTTAEVARSVLVRPQSIAGVVNNMDQRGLVVRSRPRGRGRSNPMQLTGSGAELLSQVWPRFEQANTAGNLGLSQDQTASLPLLMSALLAAQEADRR
ncbi:MarR family winged helix-turn-helix transcriptional regulator [Aeromicrobium sp.]|uniref:MarR family winged helix-turn-helix transcriptional regulator n=1 Tax=Aeromicrobium sp. TaxID=1871063 RepID=UPI0019B57A76|nr:MarR family winged helix-turn-helix transcriptional regulator [Aeromicrobium sp.]MBC7631527.1 winged helix-turn-helix transcriptional regulator [Aeromicrobium sp.]